MSNEEEIKRVDDLITLWQLRIKKYNQSGFYDINTVAEDLVLKLLNKMYGYKLKNLNYEKKNFPGIDLGDEINRIAFQVTSRRDAKKIRECLEIFSKEHQHIYPNGIYFLIINDKPKFNQKNCQRFQKIYPPFNPEKHVISHHDLIKKIKRLYDDDRSQFNRIKSMLEEEIDGKKTKRPDKMEIHSQLFKGSRRYYEALTGANGRFKHLNIADIILLNPQNELIDQRVTVEGGKKDNNVLTALPKLWKKECEHAIILGEGGMGKTVSLIRFWDEYTRKYDEKTPVPVFIALNEYNQLHDVSERKNFIVSMIKENYPESVITKEDIWEMMKTPIKKGKESVPFMVLLLDGFNEITVEKSVLESELGQIIEQGRGVQIVISSRYDIRSIFTLNAFNLLTLLKLDEERVERYLQEQNVPVPEIFGEGKRNSLRVLITNPMMLTLYASTCEVQENHREDKSSKFKDKAETPGELLWNFVEAQVARLFERSGTDKGKLWFYRYLLKFILPAIGYEMEKAGQFESSRETLHDIIERCCTRFSNEDFFRAFPEYEKYEDDLHVGECADNKERRKRRSIIIETLTQELRMLVEEGNSFRFLHQNFRDFSAAVHLLNECDMALQKGETPVLLKERPLDFFIRRLIGEIEGEHYSKPYIVGQDWRIEINNENRLHRILDELRGKFGGEVGHAVWNILEIWKEVRGELTGADLSHLDLSAVTLNGVRCRRIFRKPFLAASFNGALVHEKNLLFQGHSDRITSVVYSPDGEKILSTSNDRTIKEWDAATGECVRTFKCNWKKVTSAMYSHDGKKIISVLGGYIIKEWDATTGECLQTREWRWDGMDIAVFSKDGTKVLSDTYRDIKEWDATTGQCLQTLEGHSDEVISVVYSPDEKKILSASSDHTIKEWDATSGEYIRTLTGHSGWVTSAVYSPNGKKILSASYDRTIKEWEAITGKYLQTLEGHSDGINSAVYSPDGKKILSTSRDKTIKEWDATTGQCIQTLKGHSAWVNSAVYSPDGRKIVSTSDDLTIKEWDVTTGQCLKTMQGYLSKVKSVVYGPLKNKILSAATDGTIQEWDTVTGLCLKTLKGHSREVSCLVYSPDGKKILSASFSIIKEWDADTGECLRTITVHSEMTMIAVYSPDGQKILSASGNIIKEWDVSTGQRIEALTGHTHSVTSAVYSPDAKKILSASSDKTIKEWDTTTGQCLQTLKGHSDIVTRAIYSPDGKKILSTSWDKTIKEWDATTGKCLQTLEGHSKGVASAVYSLDGKKIFSASYDETIMEWDVVTGKCINTKKIVLGLIFQNRVNIIEVSEFEIDENKIHVPPKPGMSEGNILINIPGLFVQGCSFKDLHPGSSWSEEGLEIIKMYGADIDMQKRPEKNATVDVRKRRKWPLFDWLRNKKESL